MKANALQLTQPPRVYRAMRCKTTTTTWDPFVLRTLSKMRRLAETRPALARLLEFWIGEA
jgi:hypothetical protein